MTQKLMSNMAMFVLIFIVAAVIIAFVFKGIGAADDTASKYTKIDSAHTMHQLVMYDATIAYLCDDSVAAGWLTSGVGPFGEGDRRWTSWGTYKKIWKTGAVAGSGGGSQKAPITDDPNEPVLGSDYPFTFGNLNETFSGPSLSCFGTGTTIGGDQGLGNMIDPRSKEWRNDQEGKFSKMEFEVETDDPIYIGPCIWASTSNGNGVIGDEPPKVTDMIFHFTNKQNINIYDVGPVTATGPDNGDIDSGPKSDCIRYEIDSGANSHNSGPQLMVTMIQSDPSVNWFLDSSGSGAEEDNICNAKSGQCISGMPQERYILCDGTKGYVQTNTGFECSGGTCPDAGDVDYADGPDYTDENPPGASDREYYSDKNDWEDNSLHPFIVITDYTC